MHHMQCVSLFSLPASHPQPAYQNQYLMQMEERERESRELCVCVCVCVCVGKRLGKLLSVETGNVRFFFFFSFDCLQPENVHFGIKKESTTRC